MLSSRYLQQLLLYSICLGLVPVLALGMFSYHKSSEAVRENIKQSTLHSLALSRAAVEQTLGQIDAAVIQLISQPSFQERMNRRMTEDDFDVYRELSAALSNLPMARYGIGNVALVNVERDWIINGAGLAAYSGSAERSRIEGYAKLPKTSSWVTTFSAAADGEDGAGGAAKITLVKKLPLLSNSPEPKGLFVLDVLMDDLTGVLSPDNQVGTLTIADGRGTVLSDPGQVLRQAGEPGRRFLGELPSFPEVWHTVAGWSPDVYLTTLRSSYNDWTYISAVPVREMNRDIRAIAWITLWVTGAVAAAALLFGWLGTRKIYSPVRRLYDVARTARSVSSGDPSGDEFQFIEQRIERLVEDGDLLRGQMQRFLPQLNELFVIKLLHDQMRSEEIAERLNDLNFPQAGVRYCVLALQIDDLEENHYAESDRDLLLFAVGNIVAELVPPATRLPPVVLHETQATVLALTAADAEAFKEAVNEIVRRIFGAVKQFLRVKVSIGVGQPYERLKDTHQAFAEGLEALRYRLNLGTGIVLHYDEVHPPFRQAAPYPKDGERELLDAIRMQDEEWALACLKSFIRSALGASVSPREFQLIMGRLLLRLLELVEPDDADSAPILSHKSVFEELSRVVSAHDAETLFREEVVQPIVRCMAERRKTAYDSITQSVIGLIEREYDTNLTLESCAARLHFHPTYVGRVFRKEAGISFSEYLAQYRLNVSKKWLTESDMKVQDIAARLKYNSPAAFIRYFRNMEGVTPGQYREKTVRLKVGDAN